MPLEEDNKLTCDYAHSAGSRCELATTYRLARIE